MLEKLLKSVGFLEGKNFQKIYVNFSKRMIIRFPEDLYVNYTKQNLFGMKKKQFMSHNSGLKFLNKRKK